MDKEYILCTAIHYKTGEAMAHQPKNIDSGIVICGRRHYNCTITKLITPISNSVPYVQGFVTSLDRFVDRTEAAKIAIRSGQVRKEAMKILRNELCLISEDLY